MSTLRNQMNNQARSGNADDSNIATQMALVVSALQEPLAVIKDHPIPAIKDNEILVNNRTVGLNPIDWKSKKYRFGIYHFPWINGRESSGIIVKKGKNVKNVQIGEKVIINSTSYRDNRTSTFQQYTAIDSRLALRSPSSLSFEDGATIGVGIVTSSILLYDSFDLELTSNLTERKNNGTMLVWGGATVVGLYVTQLAKFHGLKVISVASLDNEDYIKSLGADVIIDRYMASADIYNEVLKHSKNGIQYGIDCVSKETASNVIDILGLGSDRSIYKPLFAGIVGTPKYVPDTVSVREVIIKRFHEDIEFGKSLVNHTTKLLKDGYITPVRHKSFGCGIQKIEEALKELETLGAKAEKYVVNIS